MKFYIKAHEEYEVYEHIYGMPDYLDTVNRDLTDACYNSGYNAKQAQKFIDRLLEDDDTDKFGRKHNFYVCTY